MKISGNVIEFKSKTAHYVKERHGQKPNTVRITDRTNEIMNWWTQKGPKIIRIKMENSGCGFERVVTDVTRGGEILGKTLVIISWTHIQD